MSLITQVPLCAQWEDIEVGLQVEVLNTRTTLLTKVYWIATIIRLAGTKFLFKTFIIAICENICTSRVNQAKTNAKNSEMGKRS